MLIIGLDPGLACTGWGVIAAEGNRLRIVRGGWFGYLVTLFGLEFLVAADIIHTVAVELTFTTVGVLAIVVLIREPSSASWCVPVTPAW